MSCQLAQKFLFILIKLTYGKIAYCKKGISNFFFLLWSYQLTLIPPSAKWLPLMSGSHWLLVFDLQAKRTTTPVHICEQGLVKRLQRQSTYFLVVFLEISCFLSRYFKYYCKIILFRLCVYVCYMLIAWVQK